MKSGITNGTYSTFIFSYTLFLLITSPPFERRSMAPRMHLIILAHFLVMLDGSQGWKQLRTQTPPICSLRDLALTSWSPWIDCTFSSGKMARQWRKRQAFKLTNCFGNSQYPYRWTFLCRSGVAISGAITVGLCKTFGLVASKVSVDFVVRKVSNIAIR